MDRDMGVREGGEAQERVGERDSSGGRGGGEGGMRRKEGEKAGVGVQERDV